MQKGQSFFLYSLKNENGSAIVIAIMILAVVTIIGFSSITTSTTELSIAVNDQLNKIAFYAAESARGYVPPNTNLYNGDNIDPDSVGINFPLDDVDNNGDGSIDELDKHFSMISNQSSFDGIVKYLRSSQPPRGSGYEVGKFKAHKYIMTCYGHAPRNTECTIESGFYRIGF